MCDQLRKAQQELVRRLKQNQAQLTSQADHWRAEVFDVFLNNPPSAIDEFECRIRKMDESSDPADRLIGKLALIGFSSCFENCVVPGEEAAGPAKGK
jgi:hypothetical protein